MKKQVFTLLLLLLGLFSESFGQSITIQSKTPSNTNANTVCEGGAITLRANYTACTAPAAAALTYQWQLNGTNIGGATSQDLTIPSFDAADIGVYTVDISGCTAGAAASATASYFLIMAIDPDIQITTVDPLCEESGNTLITEIPSSANFGASCATCASYVWEFDDGGGSPYASSSTIATITSEIYAVVDAGLSGGGSGALSSLSTLTLIVTGTDGYGCEWSTTTNVPIGHPPFSAFTLPASYTVGTTPIDLSSGPDRAVDWLPTAATIPAGLSAQDHYATTNLGTTSGSNYYPLTAGPATITYTAITSSGCTYTADDDVDVVGNAAFTFNNTTNGLASATWEACAHDEITIDFSSLAITADSIIFPKKGGGSFVLPLDGTLPLFAPATTYSGAAVAPYTGTITILEIPDSAFAGYISIKEAITGTLVQIPTPLDLHNPETGFALVKTPLCYKDTIGLFKVPNGGTFSAWDIDTLASIPVYTPNTDLIVGNTLLACRGMVLNNALENKGGDWVRLQYDYRPTYNDGTTCAVPVSIIQDVFIRDNRLNSAFLPTVNTDTSGTYILNLNDTLSGIFPPPVMPYILTADTAFSGTFVQQNTTTGDYEFLVGLAGPGEHIINLEMDNGGCLAETELRIYVQPPATIPNLPSVICAGVDSVYFNRDTNLVASNTTDVVTRLECNTVVFPPIGPGLSLRPQLPLGSLVVGNRDLFEIGETTAAKAAPGGGVVIDDDVDSTGQSISFCIIVPHYTRVREANTLSKVATFGDDGTPLTENEILQGTGEIAGGVTNFGNPNGSNFALLIPTIQAAMLASGTFVDTSFYVVMVYQTREIRTYISTGIIDTNYFQNYAIQRVELISNFSIGIIDSMLLDNYCFNQSSFSVPVTPAFEPGYSVISITKLAATNTTLVLPDDILDIENHPFFQDSINRTYIINYEYSKYFGCNANGTDTFTVIAPVEAFFNGPNTNNTYCVNQQEVFFTPFPAPTSGLGGIFTGNGMGVDNLNNPTVNNMFSPTMAGTGNHNITYTFTDPFGCVSTRTRLMRVRAAPTVTLAADQADLTYCANDTAAILTGLPVTSAAGTGTYFGPTVVGDNIFHPNQAYLIDSSAAAGGVQVRYEFVDTFGCKGIANLSLSIQTLPVLQINNLASTYCANAPLVTNMQGIDLTGIAGTGYFTGQGIVGTSSYSPNQAGAGMDTVWYIRTNTYGCRDSVSRTVTIDTVPQPIINNLAPEYCINDPGFVLLGSPTASPPVTTGIFTGLGINFNSSTGTYSFTPQTAANSGGVGQNIVLTYTFTDSRSCVGTVKDTTIVHGLPIGNFVLPTSYCVDDPADTLATTISGGPFSSYYFSGDGIIDTTIGALSPAVAAAANGFGLQTVVFYFTDNNNCQNTTSRNYILHNLPVVTIAGLNSGYCTNNSQINIQGFPSGTIGTSAYFHTTLPIGTVFNVTSATEARASIEPNGGLIPNNTYSLIYEYTDGNSCTNRDTSLVEFFAPPNPIITNLDTQYCETQDTFLLNATPVGGFFSGPGTTQGTNYFMPFRAGSGVHTVSYTASNTNTVSFSPSTTIACTETYTQNTTVSPLPVPFITSPINNASFCENEPRQRLYGAIQNMSLLADSIYTGTGVVGQFVQIVDSVTLITGQTIAVLLPDSIYYFDPAVAGPGTHQIAYEAINVFGCREDVTYSYTVYAVPQPGFFIDSVFCESDSPVFLSGTPTGGIFSLNGTQMTTNVYYPNPGYPNTLLTTQIVDTLIYTASNAQCVASDTNYVRVNPNPVVTYQAFDQGIITNQACLGQDTLNLVPNIAGGTFSGSGVLFGSSNFIANVAGVGAHQVKYEYTDSTTHCSDLYLDTFYVYSTPHVLFEVDGGCGDTSIIFLPDNGILGLNGNFLGNLFDSITAIQWSLGDGVVRNELPIGNQNQVDTLHHLYLNPGIYNAILFVENQNYCSGADTVRVIVSPAVAPTSSSPYFENFNTTNGGWFEEAEVGNQSSNLWAWNFATGNHIKTLTDTAHYQVWVTNPSGAYGQNASGWVYSPCFDLTTLDRPMIKFDYYNDTDPGNDGVVVEYYNNTYQEWLPLGNVGGGINWYNYNVVAGRPGIQDLAPKGWSGINNSWKDGRYKLDDFNNYEDFRLRIAFGAVGVSTQGLEGFAFDNVWIGNRTRNVLLEHFSNKGFEPSSGLTADDMNQYVYNLIYTTPLVQDVVLVQYNTNEPWSDEFNEDNQADPSARRLYYGLESGKSVIDGVRFGAGGSASMNLAQSDFEHDMLESPKFDIELNPAQILNGVVQVQATITANEAMPFEDYFLRILVVEDSMAYASGEQVHSVMRKMMPDAIGKRFQQSWTTGQSDTMYATWNFNTIDYNEQNMSIVAFVQRGNQNNSLKDVFQVESTRDISSFTVGADEVEEVIATSQEVSNMNLYPNPARDMVTVQFDTPLSQDYDWSVVDLQGRVLRVGTLYAGEDKMTIENYDWASGMYVFIIKDPRFKVYRKFVIMND